MMTRLLPHLLVAAAAVLGSSNAFSNAPRVPTKPSLPASSKHPASVRYMTILAYNGKKKNFKAGSPLSVAVKALGVPVKYSCKKYAWPR